MSEEIKQKCQTCGARIDRERTMSRFETDVLSFLRHNRFIRRDSCILCVQKHIGAAMQYYREMLNAKNSGTVSHTAVVNIKLNHLSIIGELQCAIDESMEYTELNEAIIQQERNYRYEGIEPNWEIIAALIVKYETSTNNEII